ncbi:MAG: DUF5658 family protein [Phycisphaerales bacterium]
MPSRMPDAGSVQVGAQGAARGGLTLSLLASPRVRGLRVGILLLSTCILGLYDLALTLVFSTSVGMVELNPVARLIMRVYDSPWVLAAWKLLTMGLSAWIIWRVRHRRIGEVAAWIAMAVLVMLCLHWVGFVRDAAEFASEYHTLQSSDEQRYVVMGVE